jgi:uncharacterized protein (DUF885 family)
MTRPGDIRRIADTFWDGLLEVEPLTGTEVGDPRFDDRLPDPSPEGLSRREQVARGAIEAAAAIDRAGLDEDARTTLDVMETIARNQLAVLRHRLDRFDAVSHLSGPGQLLPTLATLQRADTPEEAERYVARLRAVPSWLGSIGDVLRESVASGVTAPGLVVDRTIGQIDRLLGLAPEASPGMAPLPDGSSARDEVAGVLRDDVWPAYAGYAEALRAYRPHARESIGLCDLSCGEEAYTSLIAQHTTVTVEARTVHELGERELAVAKEEERAVAAGMGYAGAAEAIEAYTASGANTPATRGELLELARDQVRRSWDAAPRFFGRLPATPCTVKAVEEFRERDMPPAFYYPPAGDGSRDGIYYVNLGDLPRRHLHAMAAISFHEANPGHHFQLTLEVEHRDRHPLRRFGGAWASTAFVEGWGLYSERLADEMGLYTTPYERLGMLAAQGWRAVRLIVDTGIHAFGWDRQRAVDMLASAGVPRPVAEAEIDRYITMPAQALAYKVGHIEIERWRKQAEADGSFSIRAFHDRLLELGSLPLPVIQRELAG